MKKIVLLTLFLAFATVQAAPNPKYQAKYAAAAAAYQKQDFQAAFKILLPLAQQGDKTAQNNVAVLYLDGLGIPKNPKMALMWFAKAAAQGEAEAQFMAGLMYSEGNGTAHGMHSGHAH